MKQYLGAVLIIYLVMACVEQGQHICAGEHMQG
jgi:hypothetical protein